MRELFAVPVLALGLSLAAGARDIPSSPVTVVLEYDHPQSGVSFSAMTDKLQVTMDQAGVQVDVRNRSSLPENAEFEHLLIFKMKGSCTMSVWPGRTPSNEEEPLAMSYTVKGEVLPFGEVECDRVRQSLRRILGPAAMSKKDETAYGSALAVVMAHEIYHMMANATGHTHEGITKEKLSAHDLLDGKLPLSDSARNAIGRSLAKHKPTAD